MPYPRRSFLGLVAAAVMLAGCGELEDVPLVQPGTQTGNVVFVNSTSHPIIDLRFNPCDRQIWGAPDFGTDRLGGARIPPGGQQQFTVSAGCYRMRAMTGGGTMFSFNNLEDFQVFSVAVGGTTTVNVRRPKW